MGDPIITVDEVTKQFRDGTRALDGLSLTIPQGVIFGLLGPNGAGKTTLIRILATLLRPDSGTARIAGYDVARHPAAVRDRIGLAGQFAAVDDHLTGRENIIMIGRLYGLSRRDATVRTELVLRAHPPRRRCGPAGQDLLGRHAPPHRPGRLPHRPPAGAVPRRTHDRRRPGQPPGPLAARP